MVNLSEKSCEACRADAPKATEEEIAQLMPGIPEWERISVDGVERLRRIYRFPDFASALAFSNSV